ncbi:hypothetical protein ACUXCC_001421 [Cytobacillus horneckiae]|uniref:Fur-regulated basic protein FbpA n=1 Tax=Cytobacillus horneckiae TaxID=549687 RepID=A0A2N0ZLJ3_9BACI|nr:Fur-regulated basic protein FbpA [Cytobacillus horneckiae]NRG43786.1 Fur-regulated basic protein FbpA [Bacillus sp. CRN 9]MBN6885814.1 Fur-regulated basic protein FbpA [Cytobacillus horneckiae]MCM3177360.1 Fur-regulated basic protein FbpA [Cytobacillus horneckiae]MEC1156076.1 Fur-regulated basic protein FbpA [Cytobacillus horneckiae]MED2937436.1 Fur-regulated basic protein FbpA [Cytobacillus horneckiae]
MQYLRKAVEKKRNYLIQLLKENKIHELEKNLQNLTLSELEGLSKKYLSVK